MRQKILSIKMRITFSNSEWEALISKAKCNTKIGIEKFLNYPQRTWPYTLFYWDKAVEFTAHSEDAKNKFIESPTQILYHDTRTINKVDEKTL